MGDPALRVFLGATTGRVSGVDVFSAHLARGLAARGHAAEILLTEPHGPTADPMAFPADVAVRRLGASGTWWSRWKQMVAFLSAEAPCIYVPNYDWFYSSVSPRLPRGVAVVGIVHSDDPMHYEHVARLGAAWNAIVCVSETILERTTRIDPGFAPRLHRIPYGVDVATGYVARNRSAAAPLRIAYAGRLVTHQKRCQDLAAIATGLADRGVPFQLTIAGEGDDGVAVRAACAGLEARELVRFRGTLANEEVLKLFGESDVFLLPSDFEGLPVSLLEAMGRGCVPVVADSPSGIPELVDEGVTGFRVPIGDIVGYVERLAGLQADPERCSAVGRAAWQRTREGGFTVTQMVERYEELFTQVSREAATGAWQRVRGPVLPPEPLRVALSLRSRIPEPIRLVARGMRRGLRRVLRIPGALLRRARQLLA